MQRIMHDIELPFFTLSPLNSRVLAVRENIPFVGLMFVFSFEISYREVTVVVGSSLCIVAVDVRFLVSEPC